ncbi:MAG: Zn-dependent alcohol dehydrogenase [Nevskia sp.]|nr:Zn-dependent alcohol dehydrogenase [Nevskia sp.]
MKAAVLEAIDAPLRVEELELDEPKSGEVRIRIVACGVCHSDYSYMKGILRMPLPAVPGHEAGGVVEAVGPGVQGFAPGDHVIGVLTPNCGVCDMCRENKPFLCIKMMATMGNGTMLDGTTRLHRGGTHVHHLCGIAAFAEHAVVPAGSLVKIEKDVPLETVCLIGCGVTTGVGAVLNTAQVKPDTTVAVLGCGGVGLSIVQGARIAGARTIIAVDPVAAKRELAQTLGATHAIDPAAGDVAKAVKKITGLGVHYAFEAIGRVDTIALCYAMLRPTGLAVAVGVAPPADEVRLRAGGLLQQKALIGSAYGSAVPSRDIPLYVDLYRRGELKLDQMITHRIALDQVNDAFETMVHGQGARSVIVFG